MSERKLVNLFVDLERRQRPSRRVSLVEFTGLELLDRRILPAVTASLAVDGTLRVIGDDQDNIITVSRNAAGTILVNNGAVATGGATVANTHVIFLNGGAGNDNLSLNETNGALPVAKLDGGGGDDVLTGGSVGDVIIGAAGNDTLFGGAGNDEVNAGLGNDTVFLGAGDDTFQWNPGEGNDVVEGQGGRDTLLFNGSDVAEKFDISDSGNGLPFHRVRLTRDVGNVTMDLNGIEEIDLNANGGADTITVNDQTATDLFDVNLDLGTVPFNGILTGDGQADAVIINGTNGDDFGQIASFDNGKTISANVSFFPFVNITGAEGTRDHLTVNALGGNDVVDASSLPANLIGLTVNLGDGQPPPANAPPTLAPIADQTVTAGQSLTLTLQGNDPAGRPLTYSATVNSLAYHLKSTLGLSTAGNFFTNVYGGGEQWVQGTGGVWYYILPSGAFYQWSGSGLTGTLVGQLDPSYNANPGLLINAQPGQGQATVSINGSTLTITPNAGFTGLLFVTATVSDGPKSASQAFQLTVTASNAPPTLAPIANQTVAAGQSLTLTLQGNDPNGLPLTYSATVNSLAYHLKSTLGLFTTGNFFTNFFGGGEQWVQGTGALWYYILPSGAFYQWSGSGLTGTLVAQLDSSYNANPSLLVNAQPGQGQATVSIRGSMLTITPNPGFTGRLFVTATVSDGQKSASQAFQLTVS